MKNRYIQIFSCLIALLSFATFPACELDDEINFVKHITIFVTTNPITDIGSTYAVVGGEVKVTSNNTIISDRGVVYSTSPNPTFGSGIGDIIVSGGSGWGPFGFNLENLLDETKYYVRAYAFSYGKVFYGEEKSFTTTRAMYENGHEYIDLGLSVKWATMNVGASEAGDYGGYFAWGETSTKSTYSWSTYKWCNGSETTLTKYNTDSSYGTVDNKTQLDLSDDATRANWGGAWRMPTDAEWTELREECTWTWTMKGYKVKSKNGNFIFLPAAGYRYGSPLYDAGSDGYYWSSSLNTDYPCDAWSVRFNSSSNVSYYNRYFGQSVRPVLGENESVQQTAPAVTTAVVTQITETSAVVGGNVTSDGNASVTERGVCIATVSNPTTANTKISAGSGTGTFNCNLTNLQPNTKYYVRAYAINSKGTAYGNEVTFTTSKTVVLPTVTTSAITQIMQTSAVAGGNVTSDGNANVTERGVVYSTNPNPVITNLNNTIRPCGSGTGEFTYTITGLQSGMKYYIRAYAKNDVGTAYGEEVSFTTKVPATPEYVDLGLSVKWATFNVGASTPEEYGDYFAWGETQPKDYYDWSTYKWCNGDLSTLTKYNTSSSYGTVDNKTTLELNDDAARANWGGSWRMPTDAEMTELRTNCTWTWTTENGVNGYKVTSKSNGNSIFLPAAGYHSSSGLDSAGSDGYYWSSSLWTDYPDSAMDVGFSSSRVYRGHDFRSFGQSVRLVCP